MEKGFILLHRKIIKEWEWYSNTNDTRLWIHCLLRANWEDSWFEGILIERGSFATSYKSLANETGLTVQQVRTSLNHLKSTHNITMVTNKQFSIISIKNYDKYQPDNTAINKRPTNDQQTTNKRLTTSNKEKIISMYVSNNKRACARVLNSIELDLIESWLEDYDFEMVKRAVEIALLKNKDLLSYPDGILRNWKSKGYSSIEDVYENEGKVEVEENKEPVEIFTCDWLNVEEIE